MPLNADGSLMETEVFGETYKGRALYDVMERYVRAAFDPKKLLYASNWPVVGLNSTLAGHLRLMRELFGDDEDFFLGNARRAYGIDAVPPERGAD